MYYAAVVTSNNIFFISVADFSIINLNKMKNSVEI
jgi:hypothetical protein